MRKNFPLFIDKAEVRRQKYEGNQKSNWIPIYEKYLDFYPSLTVYSIAKKTREIS